MNAVLKTFLSMSCSGGLLILTLFLGKRFWKDKISRQWQYYIWLVIVLRLLLPFGSERNLLGKTYQAVDQAIAQAVSLPQRPNSSEDVLAPTVDLGQNREIVNSPTENETAVRPLQEVWALLTNHIWLIWPAVALGMLIRKLTIYQGFMRYINAGLTPVSDLELLDRLSLAAEQAGVQKPVELCVNPLISSPLLIGFFRPCIVLPSADIPEKNFQYIVLHELIHYKRRDMFYKWLIQITVCLHWFNPLVYLMSWEIAKACEFSCDEAVLAKMGWDHAQNYGKALLDAMAAVGKYKGNLGAVTLSENKQLLKERLGAIMNGKKKSTAIRLLTGMTTLCVMLGAFFVGVYPAAAAANDKIDKPQAVVNKNSKSSRIQENTDARSRDYASQAERYYEEGNLPLFQIVFSRLDEETQEKWLEKIYADSDFAFFSVAVRGLDANSSLFASFAEKAYINGDVAFFSTLADCMDAPKLELWLDRALDEGNWTFQSMLFHRLDKDEEFDQLKDENDKKWAEAQRAEYQAAGITMDGKNYYYQGQLVNIFLDIRPNKSFYTLNINPKGTVNIQISRNERNKIAAVSYMTEEEVTELLGDMNDEDDDDWDDDWQDDGQGKIWHPKVVPVDLSVMAAGKSVFLGEYSLSAGDRIWYNISAETGNRMKVFFTKDERQDTAYWSVDNLRQPGESLNCIADFTVGPSTPGTYKLYLQAPEDSLGNVKGSISIGSIADAS